ncbi:hypothetical protein QBC35DRAFT_41673 [Podospora australis]|uniref:Uncharacterized protein n=1 Tax=Podospora australis TaxID=1536484 RepID=A0AAN6WNU0_9PEZI|nr:hypothetical protein QBC35DRAFT_41673 [Podospora australis]
MGRLPPAEKLSLAVRKNVRDEWDNNKADIEQQLSSLLETTWTIDITPNAIWPYHNDGYAKESLGSCIKSYVEGAIYQIKYLTERYAGLKAEINDICHAHVLTLDLEENSPPRFSYGGGDVQDGKLRVLFVENNLGTNIDYCLEEKTLFDALNMAPSGKPLSFRARQDIRDNYDPNIAEVRHQIAEILGKTDDQITLTPNFDENFAKLAAYGKTSEGKTNLREDWQSHLGNFALKYLQALVYQMKYIKVGEDELIQEGFLEAVSTNEMALRVVDKLSNSDSSYNELVIEDGILYLQTTPQYYGTNIDYIASKLMDAL